MSHAEIILRKFLDTILDELNYSPRDVQIKQISSGGANYTTDLFEITVISPNKGTLQLFSKVGNFGEQIRREISVEKIFETERLVYTKLVPAFKTIEDKYDVPEEHRYHFAKYFGSSLEAGAEVFVFENLNKKGFQIYGRLEALGMDHVSANMSALAKFHALSFALERDFPDVYNAFSKITVHEFGFEKFVQGISPKVEASVQGLKEEYRTKVLKFIKDGGFERFIKFFEPFGQKILVHADYRPSNILYKEHNGKITTIPVDYQATRYSCGLFDLLYYITFATDHQFRKHNFEKIADYYYSELSLSLKRIHIDIADVYPKEQFRKELKEMLPYTMLLGISFYPLIMVDEEAAPDLTKSSSSIASVVPPANSKSLQRLEDLVKDFINWKLL